MDTTYVLIEKRKYFWELYNKYRKANKVSDDFLQGVDTDSAVKILEEKLGIRKPEKTEVQAEPVKPKFNPISKYNKK